MNGLRRLAMRTTSPWRTGFAACAAAMLVAAIVPASAATAATAGAAACSKHGVTVVVDFRHFHHGIKRGCDATRPPTGLVALTKAGFSYTFVPRYP